MTAIQFLYEQLPCRQGWQFIYFNLTDWENYAHQKQPAKPLYSGHPAQAGDWWAWSISAGSSCSGLNMLTPLKLARDPSSESLFALPPDPVCARVSQFLRLCACVAYVCLHVLASCVCLSVLMYDHESGVQMEPAPTILLGTALFLIRTDRLFACLFSSPSPFSRLLLSPLCQLDTQAAKMQNHRHTHTLHF